MREQLEMQLKAIENRIYNTTDDATMDLLCEQYEMLKSLLMGE